MNDNNKHQSKSLAAMSLAALGVVYGDIGTSPLYALRVSLDGMPIDELRVVGVLSMIFWALMLVVSLKYLMVVFRADNDGEGGILALLSLIRRSNGRSGTKWFFILGIFGSGLMIGDGMLTPAISVISAMEGLKITAPELSHWIVPISFCILVALFMLQSAGTEKIGVLFGPIILIWFVVIGALGINQIIKNPIVLEAISPHFALYFLSQAGWKAYAIFGGVFLVITGAEALFADLGHFNKKSIRLSWYGVALPGLLLNYFGQGAHILLEPEAFTNPFYSMAPEWFAFPLLLIATCATIIASQAVISATFSVTKQAVTLGLYPHLSIIQTSESARGQVYIPQVNMILAIGTLALVVIFQSSDGLAHAYGIAVNLEMVITTALIAYLAWRKWQWNPVLILAVFTTLFAVDFAFLGANLQKLHTGGWLPVLFAFITAVVMHTWHMGMNFMRTKYTKERDITEMLKLFRKKSINRLPNVTAIFITDIHDQTGGSFLKFLKLSKALPENILIVNYKVENHPYVTVANRFEVQELGPNIFQLTLNYGFMDMVSIPLALSQVNKTDKLPFKIDTDLAVYLVEIPYVTASKRKHTLTFFWQEKLFAYLWRNCTANLNIDFYRLPFNRTVAIGTYIVL